MKVGELNHWHCHLYLSAVNILGIDGDGQLAFDYHLAALGDCLEHPVAQAVGGSSQLQPIKTVSKPNLL